MKQGEFALYYGSQYPRRRGHLVYLVKGYKYEKRFYDVEFADGKQHTVNFQYLKPL